MLKVYGIGSCERVREACRWLDERGLAYELVDLEARRPPIAKLTQWATLLTAGALRDPGCSAHQALPDEKANWSEPRWIAAMARNPQLLRRPIFERDGNPVLVGFVGSDDELLDRLA